MRASNLREEKDGERRVDAPTLIVGKQEVRLGDDSTTLFPSCIPHFFPHNDSIVTAGGDSSMCYG